MSVIRFVSMHLLAFAASTSAQTAAPASAANQPLDVKVTNAQQKWRNAMEFNCRGDREAALAFQFRINARLASVGENGWELVSISSASLPAASGQKAECLAFGFRQPTGK